jgi:MEKHLA domain
VLQEIWTQPKIIAWTQLLLDSYEKLLGRQIIPRNESDLEQAKALFFAPFAVVSHGKEDDPILNYGNQTALALWEMNWEDFIHTPSRLTAEPVNREERQQMLLQAAKQGFIDNYRGIRISRTKKRFLIEKAIVWNLEGDRSQLIGQAATFSEWRFL